MSVTGVIDEIIAISANTADQGGRFERLMKHAFQTDRTYRERFSNVWLWNRWPDRQSADRGIDLVAEHRDGSGFTAIQCKCFAPGSQLSKHNIDSFFTESGKPPFTDRIIVATTDNWTTNAEESLREQYIPVTRLGIDELDAMTVDWTTVDINNPEGLREVERHKLRPHQVPAVENVLAGFGEYDRGKLIMACGTGKTFTALKIAERLAGPGKSVLFLAPSIALVSQTLKEWTAQTEVPLRPFAVCSDPTTGALDEGENATPFDLAIPPSTSVQALHGGGVHELPDDKMTVVFSTYQSIDVVADLQALTDLRFDLVVCDEAHRTAGVTEADQAQSHFIRVHDDDRVPAGKRLYMTATPKTYKPAAKADALDKDAVAASMDDEDIYGPEFHRLGFGEAVEMGILADYRVLILTVSEDGVSTGFQQLLSSNGELNLPDVAKFIGCLSGLGKLPNVGANTTSFRTGEPPMQRAVAFWSNIAESKRFADQFDTVAEHYNTQRAVVGGKDGAELRALSVPTRHVDGTTNIKSRRADIRWLKETPAVNECRVLTNAKCLTEGVDVPALDAVMFLKPKRSTIDIVQAVGRVMRKPPGKSMGYVILPIAIPAGTPPEQALNSNKDYDVVWDVLRALRSHDERFEAFVNRIQFRGDDDSATPDDHIQIIDATAHVDEETNAAAAEGTQAGAADDRHPTLFTLADWASAIYTQIVKKVGTRTYWEDWADEVTQIAARHETRIKDILRLDEPAAEFHRFLTGLRTVINDGISDDDAIAMLSQHLITRPIFEALFGDDHFALHNPISVAMQEMADLLDRHSLDTETEALEGFYDSVRTRLVGIPKSDGTARQQIIKDLYGQFFSKAFPKVQESLGIVYTPLEVVDFILHVVELLLGEHFQGASLSDEGVHVLDPFTGTGTFIARLLQSGHIKPADLDRKFREELHANEILLLAYYIGAVNIEATFGQLRDGAGEDFPGIVLTDTFQLGETDGPGGQLDVFPVNNERARKQAGLDIRVIIGNPPYSAGQSSANDDNPNRKYPKLDASIASTYAAKSTATLKNSLYDSYVRAIRWASDRVLNSSDGGVIGFVTNNGFVDSNTADGLRLTLAEEFHDIYVYNLRGNQRTAGEVSRREGGKVFDSGSRAGVAITFLVKRPGRVPESGARLHYLQVDDYQDRDEKLRTLRAAVSGSASLQRSEDLEWSGITPNDAGDWINQRTDLFESLVPLHSESEPSVFSLSTSGLKTNRDAWNYNSSREKLDANVTRMIRHFNRQVETFTTSHPEAAGSLPERAKVAKSVVDLSPDHFSWDRSDFMRVARGDRFADSDRRPMTATYRPFHRRWAEAGSKLNNTVYKTARVYPRLGTENVTICVPPPGSSAPPFAPFATREVTDNGLYAASATRLFPRFVYKKERQAGGGQPDLFQDGTPRPPGADDGITDFALEMFRVLDQSVSKDDIFGYVYAVLHSPHYRDVFAADLRRSLPRIPLPSDAGELTSFTDAGRQLLELHLGFEAVEPWPGIEHRYSAGFEPDSRDHVRVEKMRHPKAWDAAEGRKTPDRTRIVFNSWITIEEIPARAHDYVIGSRSGIAWVMDAHRVRVDKASGIVNDPNDWCDEIGDPRYILDLVGRVVTVSMRTLDIVAGLPELKGI